jgi:rhamnulokinase
VKLREKKYLAFDFGQSGIKAIVGKFNGRKLKIKDIYRFDNNEIYAGGYLQWDILKLYHELLIGIKKAEEHEGRLESLGIDSWGSDHSFIDKKGYLIGNPITNRDCGVKKILGAFYEIMSKEELFELTGVQLFENSSSSLSQLYSLLSSNPNLLSVIEKYLMIPDILNYFLTGIPSCEYTLMSFSQLVNQKERNISDYILNKFGIPKTIFPDIAEPGTKLGPIQKIVCNSGGFKPIEVIMAAQHDTSSAFTAVPLHDSSKNIVAISMGTWCCLGMEIKEPITTKDAFLNGFANQGGVGGVLHFRKDLPGFIIARECRKKMLTAEGKVLSWDEIFAMTDKAQELKCFIDINNPKFSQPSVNVKENIIEYFLATKQEIPESNGQLFRSIFESMVLNFRYNIEMLEKISSKRVDAVYLIGGGSRNDILYHSLANLLRIPVVIGIYDATAIGNLLVQMKSSGEISSIEEGRRCILSDVSIIEFQQKEASKWEEAYSRYLKILDHKLIL